MNHAPGYALLATCLSLLTAAPALTQDDRSPQEWLRLANEGNLKANMVVCGGYLGGAAGFAKDISKAFPFCKVYADETGNPVAQTVVANLYQQGHGVARNDAKAAKYSRLAAHQGNAAAQFALGNMHHHGRGVEKDLVEARKWYERAAAQDHAAGLTYLGNFHYRGLGGLPEDHARAARLYRRAADLGHAQAQGNLAHLLEHGKGVPKDIEEAKRLYKLAAEQGNKTAAANFRRLAGQ
ncbi:tetratricopeptide repeat protein [Roseovarius ramblicola]|uniref:Tetratricopeptide repeat protein n=1 Tax=Roseovarius ramblicola TaxID=2022336 RepID=A0ABV5I3L3_9RHOB